MSEVAHLVWKKMASYLHHTATT